MECHLPLLWLPIVTCFKKIWGTEPPNLWSAVVDEVTDILCGWKLLFYLLKDVAVSMDLAGSH